LIAELIPFIRASSLVETVEPYFDRRIAKPIQHDQHERTVLMFANRICSSSRKVQISGGEVRMDKFGIG
jgi:hypothetical protein